jgi:hypothetical protein
VTEVAAEGYRCLAPQVATPERPLRIELLPAPEAGDGANCAAGSSAASPEAAGAAGSGRAGELVAEDPASDDTLAARSLLGFGANCRGPIVDLTLAPDGRYAAFAARVPTGLEVRVADLGAGTKDAPVGLVSGEAIDSRLAWTEPGGLALRTDPSPGDRSAQEADLRLVWSPPVAGQPPAAPAPPGLEAAERAAPEAADRHDEAVLRWAGRVFRVQRAPDPASGLAREWLEVTLEEGVARSILLPGEACSLGGRFGRPEQRIASDGETALDLRWVEGGCHAIRIDLTTGDWSRLDSETSPGECRDSRRLPASALHRAVEGYARELERRLSEASLDPLAAFTLEIDSERNTRLVTRDLHGEPRVLDAPEFPIATPLRRLEVTAAGAASERPTAPAGSAWRPL